MDSGYGGSSSRGWKAGEDSYVPSVGGGGTPRSRPSEDEYAPRRSKDANTGVGRSSEDAYASSVSSSGRKASQDTTTTVIRRSEDMECPDSASEYRKSPVGGLSTRLRGVVDDADDAAGSAGGGGGARSGDDYYDTLSLGRVGVASDRSGGVGSRFGGGGSGRGSALGVGIVGAVTTTSAGAEDQEKLRREYEYRIATTQTRIEGLERENHQ